MQKNNEEKPKFCDDFEEVTREVADKLAFIYNSLVKRKKEIQLEKPQIQRFVLQCLVALFVQNELFLLSNPDFFKDIIQDCIDEKSSSYDSFKELFETMNMPEAPIYSILTFSRRHSKNSFRLFHSVSRIFLGHNIGLFKEINPIELNKEELLALKEVSDKDWSKVQLYILGQIFEDSMDKEDRHAYGAHFSSQADIMKIVEPTILRQLKEEFKKAKCKTDYERLLKKIANFKVLDLACGSGTFLYIAFRELKLLEIEVYKKMIENCSLKLNDSDIIPGITSKNFYGMDINEFAVEIAKVTMSIAKIYAAYAFNNFLFRIVKTLSLTFRSTLPFDNMDSNIVCNDTLFKFNEWEEPDVIIGNTDLNKVTTEFIVTENRKVTVYTIPFLLNKETGLFEEMEVDNVDFRLEYISDCQSKQDSKQLKIEITRLNADDKKNPEYTEYAWGFWQRHLKTDKIPKLECPNCKEITFTPTRVVGSHGTGNHTISGYCANCGFEHTNLKNLDYYNSLHKLLANDKGKDDYIYKEIKL